MRQSAAINRLTARERINFLLTNRLPRRWATLFVGRISRIENRVVTRVGLRVWRAFAGDFGFHESKHTRFKSIHDCFTRELKPGARPVVADRDVVVSPCDGIIGSHGAVDGVEVFQAKGFPYTLDELLCDAGIADRYRNGSYVTLRLASHMYHRFHAPVDGSIAGLRYVSGDTWNVNPIALKRIERLFCKNERAVIDIAPDGFDGGIAVVPIASILVASIKLHFLDGRLDLRYRGPNVIACSHAFGKGDELGYFEHGSTIVVLATPGFRFDDRVVEGRTIRMGEALLRRRL
jgi:phosphatidylserine decarboxylase